MLDVDVAELAGSQFNRVSSEQLRVLGASAQWVSRRVGAGRLVRVEPGVFAVPPLIPDDRGRWMGATLISRPSYLCDLSAAVAWGLLSYEGPHTTVVRPGSGGPRRAGSVSTRRSKTLEGDCTELDGIPITTVARTLLDIASRVSSKALARALREAVRLGHASLDDVVSVLVAHPRAHGTSALRVAASRYSGLPLENARSGAEVRALEILRDHGRPLPALNAVIARERADLSWPAERLIVEIDGAPFHLDVGEDARKARAWKLAGWTVARIDSNVVYEAPKDLIALYDSNVRRMLKNEHSLDVRPVEP